MSEKQEYQDSNEQLFDLSSTQPLDTCAPDRIDDVTSPASDSEDPHRWPQWKKNAFLIIICFTSALPDFATSTGAITLLPQSKQWHLALTTVNHALTGFAFTIGVGGLCVVALSSHFGRLPVLVYFLSIFLLTTVWCAVARTFDSFMAARIIGAFFSPAGQSGGLMWINDMYYPFEHPRKINIWSSFILIAPFVGPVVSAFIVQATTWRWVFGVLTILTGICWVLVVLFLDETFYRPPAVDRRIGQPKSRPLRLLGIEQHRRRVSNNSLKQAFLQPCLAIAKLPVFLACLHYLFIFAWLIGLNSTISVRVKQVYGFGYKSIAFFNFSPIVGLLIGSLVSHLLQIMVTRIYSRRKDGIIEPEARLLPIWIATPLLILGLVLIGATLHYRWPYMILAVIWPLYIAGIIIVTTALNAYCLQSYPEASGEVAAWINEARSIGAFVITYVELDWTKSTGALGAMSIQAIVVVVVSVIIVILQIYGKRLRERQGPVTFEKD